MSAVSVGFSVILPILPFLIERLAGTADRASVSLHTGLLTGIYVFAIFVFAPVWGRISDARARKPVMLFGLTGFALTFTLFALFDSLALLYLGRFLNGAFAAAVAPAIYALVGDQIQSKQMRAYRLTLLNVAATAGFFIGPLLGGLALRASGTTVLARTEAFLVPFVTGSVLALLAALAIRVFVTEAPRQDVASNAINEDSPKPGVVLRLCAIAFVTTLAIGAFEVSLSLRGKQTLGMEAYQIGLLFAECSIVMLLAQALVFSPLTRPDSTRWLLTPGLVGLALGLALVPLASGGISTIAAVALVAASAGILPPIVTYWVSLSPGNTGGTYQGWVTSVASLGQAVGSVGGGLLFDVSLIPNAAFVVAALVVLTGLVASFGLPRLLVPRPK
jgi:MFS family permease